MLEDVFALGIAGPLPHQLLVGERGDMWLDMLDPFDARRIAVAVVAGQGVPSTSWRRTR